MGICLVEESEKLDLTSCMVLFKEGDPMKIEDPMEVTATSLEQRDSRLCSARNRKGEPCRKFSMQGQRVCKNHGGGSPQALAKAAAAVELAELRIRGLAPRAVDELERLVTGADSEQVRLQAANSLVDRSVGRATERVQIAAAITVKRPW
jgi:hypothetical protein